MPETYMSRCHEAQGDWTPEVGSPAYQRRWDGMQPAFEPEAVAEFGRAVKCMASKRPILDRTIKSGAKKGTKHHWIDNKICSHVMKTGQERVLVGDRFNAVPKGERCICCDYWFTNG